MKTKKLKSLFDKWITRLGLRWWDIEVHWHDDPETILNEFGNEEGNILVVARTHVRWEYARAWIHVNLPLMKQLSDQEAERCIVHELVHILVNEMREGETHHEERVVTQITKAIFWTLSDFPQDKEA